MLGGSRAYDAHASRDGLESKKGPWIGWECVSKQKLAAEDESFSRCGECSYGYY
jgi:hypothetical protein